MNALRNFFHDYSHTALTGMAVGLTVLVIGGGSIVVGGTWVCWRLLDALHFPTETFFRAACWLFYWPGLLIEGTGSRPDELKIVVISVLVWFACLAMLLNAGRCLVKKLEA